MKDYEYKNECNHCGWCLGLIKTAKKMYYNVRDKKRAEYMKGDIKYVKILL